MITPADTNPPPVGATCVTDWWDNVETLAGGHASVGVEGTFIVMGSCTVAPALAGRGEHDLTFKRPILYQGKLIMLCYTLAPNHCFDWHDELVVIREHASQTDGSCAFELN